MYYSSKIPITVANGLIFIPEAKYTCMEFQQKVILNIDFKVISYFTLFTSHRSIQLFNRNLRLGYTWNT